jgi:hypothetical protein
MKTQFGTATFLLRAGVTAGRIRVRASAPGLKSAELEIVSTAPRLPLLYSDTARTRLMPLQGPQLNQPIYTNTDLEKIKEENNRLRLQLTSKEQEIMEMRSRVNK